MKTSEISQRKTSYLDKSPETTKDSPKIHPCFSNNTYRSLESSRVKPIEQKSCLRKCFDKFMIALFLTGAIASLYFLGCPLVAAVLTIIIFAALFTVICAILSAPVSTDFENDDFRFSKKRSFPEYDIPQ